MMTGATAGEIFVVVKATSAAPSANRGLMRIGPSAEAYPNTSGQIYETFGTSTPYTVGLAPSGVTQYSIYDVSAQAGQWTARLDGVTLLNSTSNTVNFGSPFYLGSNASGGFDGGVAEIIVYNTVLTAAQRTTVGQYLEGKYNLPGISVPANPTGLVAKAISGTEVSLVWSDAATTTGITYTVWRETGSGGYTAVAQVSNGLSYVDSGLTAGTNYSYEISSSTLAGSSPGYSTAASVTTLASGTDMPLTGMKLWLIGDSGAQATSSGSLIQWLDQSGNGNNGNQLTTTQEPAWTANALNGRPVVTFTASSAQYLNLPSTMMTGVTAGEIFVVVKATSAAPSVNRGLMRIGPSAESYPNTSGQIYESFGTSTPYTVGYAPSGITQYSIYDVSAQAGQWTARLDGVTLLNSTSNTVNFGSPFYLGSNASGGFDGGVAEVILYNSVLTAAQRATVGQYLEGKYNLPGISVPANPTGLVAKAVSGTEVCLVWSDAATATGITYTVWRETGSGGYSAIAQVSNGLSYLDRGLTAGINYSYEISSSTLAGSSPGYSTAASVTTLASGTDMPLTGMNLWLIADSGVQANSSGSLIQWLDQSGNGNNATQLTTSQEPVWTANVLNGRPVVTFTASSAQYLNLPSTMMTGATAGEIFVVVKATSAAPSAIRGLMRIGPSTEAYPNTSGQIVETFGTSSANTVGYAPSGITQYSIYNISAQAGQWTARLDGITLLNSTTNTVNFGSPFYLGSNSGGGFDGGVAEVIVYNTVLTAAQRATVGQYLEGKYNLPGISVPANPTGLVAKAISGTEVSLVWSDAATTTGITYTVWRETGSGGYSAIAQVSNGLSYVDSGLTAGTNYSYEISSSTLAGFSPGYSTAASVTTMASGTDMPLTGMKLWLIGDSGAQATSSGSLIQWLDQSGNGNNANQLTTTQEPALVANVLNGRPAVTFTASSAQYLNLPSTMMTGATAGEIFVVVKATSAAPSANRGLMRIGPSTEAYPNTSGQIVETFGTSTANTVGLAPSGITQYSIYNVSAQSGQWTARLDSVTLVDNTTNTVNFGSPFYLGSNSGGGFDGGVAEVILYNSVLTAAQRATVGQYLEGKYSLPGISLPANPSNLVATPISSSEVTLTWSGATIPTGVTYTIWRETGSGGYSAIAQVGNGLSYVDSGLTAGTNYSYQISANTLAGSSPGYSTAASVTTLAAGSGMPLTGMKLWLIADSGVEVNASGGVTEWLDQSGNGNNATQFTASAAPTLTANALNGHPVLTVAASGSQFLNLPNVMNGATAGEVFVVVKATSAAPTANRGLMNLGSGNGEQYPNVNGDILEQFGSTTNYTVGTTPSTIATYNLYNISSQSGLWTARFNDTTLLNSTTNTTAFSGTSYLGSSGAAGFDGDIAEVIVYNSVLTAAQRNAVSNYLGNKYLPFLLITNFDFDLLSTVVSSTQINLSWNGSPVGASYVIQRSVNGGSWTTIATVSAPTTTYSDTSVPAGNVIKYQIQGVDNTGISSTFGQPAIAFPNPNAIDPGDGLTYGTDQMLGIDPTAGSDTLPVVPSPTPTPTPTPTENPGINTPPTVTLITPSQATLH